METGETPQSTQPTESKPSNWTKIILSAVLGLVLLVGSACAGYYYGTESVKLKDQAQPAPIQLPEPTPVLEDNLDPEKKPPGDCLGNNLFFPYPNLLEKNYDLQDLKNKAVSLGLGATLSENPYDQYVFVKKTISGEEQYTIRISNEPQHGLKQSITVYQNGRCDFKDSYIKAQATAFLKQLDVESDWVDEAIIEFNVPAYLD